MLALGPLVQPHDFGDPLRSDTTLLAVALITLGYPRASRAFLHVTCEFLRGEWQWKTTWTFHGNSSEPGLGDLGADVVMKAWRDDSGMWLLRHPDHAVSVLRNGLRYDRIAGFTPQYSRAQLAQIATPDTWIEAGFRNLVHALGELRTAMFEARAVVRFSAQRAAFVPRCLPQSEQTRRIKFAETTDHAKRRSILAEA